MYRVVDLDGPGGIFAFYRVTGADATRTECRAYGSFAGWDMHGATLRPCFTFVEQLAIAPKPLSLIAMKNDAVLKEAKFVRRRCQGTVFEMTEREFARVERLLKLDVRVEASEQPTT